MTLTLVPAYGRDYKSKKAMLADFDAGKDFQVTGIGGSGYTTRDELTNMGHTEVHIRYKRLTQVAVVKL